LRAPEGFRSLASLLILPVEDEPAQPPAAPEETCASDCACDAEIGELLRDVRLFKARVAELVEDAAGTLLADIAAQVIARELQLAPAEIGAVIESALQRFGAEQPLRIRIARADEGRVDSDLPVIIDEALREGDAALDVAGGSVDATLGVRLDAVLRGLR
jgi:flagellar biosynthesis/type III secretory pathway protein FliH